MANTVTFPLIYSFYEINVKICGNSKYTKNSIGFLDGLWTIAVITGHIVSLVRHELKS